MTRERRFRFRTSARPGRGPTAPATPAPLAGVAAAPGRFTTPTPWHRQPAHRQREVRQRHDATSTVTRGEPLGKHMKHLSVLVEDSCDKRHTRRVSVRVIGDAQHSLIIVRRPGAIPSTEADERGLTGRRCSYRVSVQSRGAGRSGLPTENGNRRRANRGVRRSREPQTGSDNKATSVAGRRCGRVSSQGESSWRRTRRGCFLSPLPHSSVSSAVRGRFGRWLALCDSTGDDPLSEWRASGSSIRIRRGAVAPG